MDIINPQDKPQEAPRDIPPPTLEGIINLCQDMIGDLPSAIASDMGFIAGVLAAHPKQKVSERAIERLIEITERIRELVLERTEDGPTDCEICEAEAQAAEDGRKWRELREKRAKEQE